MMDIGSEVILVLGMHRTGTSAVAAAAHMLGATAPANMLPVAEDNPLGFWEPMGVLSANDWILQQGNAAWYDCLGFDGGALDRQTHATALTFIMLSMMTEYTHAALPLIKDPRLCVLLDLWLPALRGLELSPHVLLVLRHPSEVIASLTLRDNLPATVSAALWLRHMLAAEVATRDCPRHVVSYDRLLHDWRGCMDLAARRAAIAWPESLDAQSVRVAGFLEPRSRHHNAGGIPQLGPLGGWLSATYAALQGIEQDGSVAPHLQQLDTIRQAFAGWCATEGCHLVTHQLDGHPVRSLPRFEPPTQWHQIVQTVVPPT